MIQRQRNNDEQHQQNTNETTDNPYLLWIGVTVIEFLATELRAHRSPTLVSRGDAWWWAVTGLSRGKIAVSRSG